jgi:hypothetical protein
MQFLSGAEERGCGYRVKKVRIYVHVKLLSNSSSRRDGDLQRCFPIKKNGLISRFKKVLRTNIAPTLIY